MSKRLSLPTRSDKTVMLLHPEDYRRDDIPVSQEQGVGLLCDEYEGHRYKIRKLGPGWKGKKDTIWFSLEGTPLTNCVVEDNQEPLDILEFLEWAWTPDVVKQLDDSLKKKLITDFGVTVKINPVNIPKEVDLTPLKAWDYLEDHNREVFKGFAESEEVRSWKDDLFEKGILFLFGAFAMYFFMGLGII